MIIRLFLPVLFFMFFMASCSKKVKQSPAPVYPIAAYLNNTPWNTSSVNVTLAIDTIHGNRIVDITASSNDSKTITIEFFDNATGNNINIASHNFPNAYFNYKDAVSSAISYTTTYGVVSISANTASTKTLSATFDFIVKDNNNSSNQIHIHNGSLNNVSYNIIYR